MIELTTLVQYFNDAEDASFKARLISETCRDFYDGNQLTREQQAKLAQRNQPEVVFNLIQPKVDFILGQEAQGRTDPKAFPRTPSHDEAADAATDGIRYVLDNNEFDDIASTAFENMAIEGTGGCSVEAEKRGGKIEIVINPLVWNRLFIDPYSMRKDAKDALYIGYISWKDVAEVTRKWPHASKEIESGIAESRRMGETSDDKPTRWYSSTRNRVMCVDICFLHKGTWHNAIYAKGAWLEKPKESTYVDDMGVPQCKFLILSAHVDRDNQRYGFVKNDLDRQMEVNARRSKSLHLMNTRQTFAREGSIRDVDAFKREANKPDGHLTYPGAGKFGVDFGIIPNEALAGPQFQMYQDAAESMKMQGARAASSGVIDKGISGRAVRSLQGGDMIELAPLFDTLSKWKKRVYRQVWFRIKQYWREERWIRVTDNEENLKYVGLNAEMTLGEQLMKDQLGISISEVREQYAEDLQKLYADQPQYAEAVVENDLVELDVDIIIDEVPDVVNLQSEQFELLTQMYIANPFGPQNPDGIKWQYVVEMSTLRNKKRLLGQEPSPEEKAANEQQAAEAEEQKQLQMASFQSDMQGKGAKTAKDTADAEKTNLENQKMVADYPGLQIEKQADVQQKFANAELTGQKAIQTSVETGMILTRPDPAPQVNT